MKFTTMEKLQLKVSAHGAVVRYGNKVFVTDRSFYGFTADIYLFIDYPEETGLDYIECRLIPLAVAEEKFTDGGHALEWCFKHTTNRKEGEK